MSASALGCGLGLRTGSSVSRSSTPVTLESTIGEPPRTADASLSGNFVDLAGIAEYYKLRALFVLGFATGRARYRAIEPAGQVIFAKDDNVMFRAGAGIGFAPIAIGPVRPVPYLLYVTNPLTTDNVVKRSLEVGLDIELEMRAEAGAVAIVVGAALLRDTGLSYADFMTADTYKSEYTTTGLVFHLGFQGIWSGK